MLHGGIDAEAPFQHISILVRLRKFIQSQCQKVLQSASGANFEPGSQLLIRNTVVVAFFGPDLQSRQNGVDIAHAAGCAPLRNKRLFDTRILTGPQLGPCSDKGLIVVRNQAVPGPDSTCKECLSPQIPGMPLQKQVRHRAVFHAVVPVDHFNILGDLFRQSFRHPGCRIIISAQMAKLVEHIAPHHRLQAVLFRQGANLL